MATAIQAASKLQIGKEGTPGNSVAAVRRVSGKARVERRTEVEEFEDFDDGTLARTSRAPVRTRNEFGLEYQSQLDYTQLLWFLLSGYKGGVTGSGAGADKTWAFEHDPDTAPTLETYTVEWVETDLATFYEVEAPYCVCEELTIRANNDAAIPEVTARIIGRKPVESTQTAGLAVNATLKYSPNALWTVALDTTWAGLGGTVESGSVRGFEWKMSNFYFPRHYLDGRTDLDFSAIKFRRRFFDLTIDLDVDAASGGFARDEIAAKDAGSLRFARCRVVGPALGGSNYSINLDGAYYHAPDSLVNWGEEDEGIETAQIHLKSARDPTAGRDSRITVVTDVASFPS